MTLVAQISALATSIASQVMIARRGRYLAVNAQTGTSYTLTTADEGRLVTLGSASATTLTLPSDTTAAIPVGARIDIVRAGAGAVTIAPGSGATVSATPSLTLRAQWSTASAIKRAANTWLVVGDLT